MQNNYHTHTARCHHAEGSDREYIESAIAAGFKTLGFSDHTPLPPYPDPLYRSDCRMSLSEGEQYIRKLLDLRAEYARDIRILIGFEAEYYPAMFPELLAALKPYPYDYLIMGQHYLYNECDEPLHTSNFEVTADTGRLHRFVEQVTEGLATGEYAYLAHPDVLNFAGDETAYRAEMGRLCRYCAAENIPVEFNLLGWRTGRHYPSERFFRLAAEAGCAVILGCDAHRPAELNRPEDVAGAERFLARCGVTNLVEDIRLRQSK